MDKNYLHIANRAMLALRQGDAITSLQFFEKIQAANIQHFELTKAHGIALLKTGNNKAAKSRFLDALMLNPNVDELHNVVADLYKKEGRLVEAKQHFKTAIKLKPSIHQYHFNLGLCLKQAGDIPGAIELFSQARQLAPKHDKSALALARCYMAQHLISKALLTLDAIENKQSLDYYHCRMEAEIKQGNLTQAHDTFLLAVKTFPNEDTLYHNVGLALLHEGHSSAALKVFQQGVKQFPSSVSLLDLSTSLAYETGQKQPFLAYEQVPLLMLTPTIMSQHINKLINADQLTQAEQQLSQYQQQIKLKHHDADLSLLHSHCTLLKKQGLFIHVIRTIDNAAINLRAAKHESLCQLYSEALLAINEPKQALEHIEHLLTCDGSNQYYWALKASCLRLIHPHAYQQLCDYDKLVFQRELQIDKRKYGSLALFNDALLDVLEQLQQMKKQPLAQSIYKGLQTPGFLFNHQHEVIQDLRGYLLTTAKSVLTDSLANSLDSKHPVAKFYRSEFDFTTAWSIWMSQGSYHRSHVHPKGWYSSAYYAAVPDAVQSNNHQGYFALGQPGLELSSPMQNMLGVDRYIMPQAGMLTLFPSYMWHATVPYCGDMPRVSVAFDLK